MITKEDAVSVCESFPNVYEDYPFDDNWAVMRHKDNKKSFAFIFKHYDKIWINVKNEPIACEFWCNVYPSIVPAYHMNKRHWISIILDDSISDDEIKNLIYQSYKITEKKKGVKNGLKQRIFTNEL